MNVFFSIIIGAFSLGQASPHASSLVTAQGAAFRIFETIDRKSPINPFDEQGLKPEKVLGQIEFRNIDFAYPTRLDTPILYSFDLTIPAGKTIALVGSSGSGKSTIANVLAKRLHALGMHAYVLDGDNLRMGLNVDLGFTPEDRAENVRRTSEVAKLMVDAGLIVISALVSPFEADRQRARSIFDEGDFIEVFVDTPVDVCISRDPKGLYKKARDGQIPNFTGIGQEYEKPSQPELILDGTADTDANTKIILERLL